MSDYMRDDGDRQSRVSKQASLLASAQSAQTRRRGDAASDAQGRSGGRMPSRSNVDGRQATNGVRDDARRGSYRATGDARRAASRAEADSYRVARRPSDATRKAAGRDADDARSGRGRGLHARGGGERQGRARQSERESLGGFVRRNSVYIISVAAVALIVVLMLVFIRGFISDPQLDSGASATASSTDTADGATTNNADGATTNNADEGPSQSVAYNWDNLDRTNGRYAYVVDGQVVSRLGIDVSENQYDIDWQAVAADGIEFAMIRLGYRGATEGDLYLDNYFEQNLAGAKAAGIDCGVYFFSQAQTLEEAVEEADFVLEHLKGISLEYPIAFDSEEAVLNVEKSRTSGLSDTTMIFMAEAFCARVEQAGYDSLLYGNAADLSRYRYTFADSRKFWWAEYGVANPTENIVIDMWQYASDGVVAGISTETDMNIDLSLVNSR